MGKPIGRPAHQASPSLLSAMPLSSEGNECLVEVIALTVPAHSPPAQSRRVASTTRSRARLALVHLSALQTSPRQTKPLPQARGNASFLSTTAVVVLVSGAK